MNNAAKTPKPVKTDLHLLDILRKRSSSLEANGKEFAAAGREDLTTKAEGERKVVEEYAGQIKTVSEEEIRAAVEGAVAELRAENGKLVIGTVMQKLFRVGGSLEGKPASKTVISRIAKELIKP